jgi:hypothetical protein
VFTEAGAARKTNLLASQQQHNFRHGQSLSVSVKHALNFVGVISLG